MYVLKTEASFDAAHFLKGYDGKCSNLHGHRWRVEAAFSGRDLQPDGSCRDMLLDFGELKDALRALTEPLDHALLVTEGSLRPGTLAALEQEGFRMVVFPFRTTAERLARYFFEALRDNGLPVSSVTVYETPSNCAQYGEEI